ncbi:RNA polymerase sigma factor [Alcaligenes nematophilus]|jgi:RNA polymerase sigma-70 factor (ECF subfamily)|uniref:RNA polymerase sigma factor n=1 Tax=Alcaligenes nematophilus TaxID=2994643 RepID=A0ABU3MW50_9BURK|nr:MULTISPECIES: RNA polymerase sigma factor [Alcaligenes]MDK7585994.1 RNA polymerase sigma factor [Alcaligenes phenolicus]MDT8466940.1 RNA polymerase sigma factor [Alcaligenes nematophilus]MDT8470197.1 RNA polymerase sigma factor [Alcaligenes nematophilus]MDT8505958.1 RNA polymerase sigma factor [Alcaligenes nematophilus]MDT8526840.1 RNA polymerase sigma factor [Alcaligenes nematophilus]
MPTEPRASSRHRRNSLVDALCEHYDDLLAQLRRRFGAHHFAQDVLHDACLRLLERPQRPEPRSPLALLRRILHHLAIDRYRHDQRRCKHDEGHFWPEDQVCPAATPEQHACTRQALDHLMQAIQTLPPRCQEVFILHKIHHISQADVARLQAISVKTVEKHIRLGMAHCRRHMERY